MGTPGVRCSGTPAPSPSLSHGSSPALLSHTAPGGGVYGGFVVVMGLSGRRLRWPIWPWGGAAVGALGVGATSTHKIDGFCVMGLV
uniref:Uncharacterized protein n=1 Tax=Fagus sylvatica TaxID=28930 RepID=A0A2N9HLZ9_FAGSY